MTLQRIGQLEVLLSRLLVMADAEVVRHDKGPEAEPSHDLLRAVGYTKLLREAQALLAVERAEQAGETAWLSGGV